MWLLLSADPCTEAAIVPLLALLLSRYELFCVFLVLGSFCGLSVISHVAVVLTRQGSPCALAGIGPVRPSDMVCLLLSLEWSFRKGTRRSRNQ